MKKNELCIDVLGTAVTIFTDEEPDYLEMLLLKYKNTIENVKKNSRLDDPLKIAVLTGFLLSHDLEKASHPEAIPDESDGEAEQLTLGILSRLDEMLETSLTVQDSFPTLAAEAGNEYEARETLNVPLDKDDKDNKVPGKLGKAGVYKLHNPVKNYDWGSPDLIPVFLGRENPSKTPWAELWMGVNPKGPSRVIIPETEETGPELNELIDKTLPFLYKVLAVLKPLSIQVHPDYEQAREGFERENLEKISMDSARRIYHDENHKPEILCALGPFAALCGLRSVLEIHTLITKLSMALGNDDMVKNTLETLLSALQSESGNPHRDFLAALFGLDPAAKKGLSHFLKSYNGLLERRFPENKNEWKLSSFFASLYPGDPWVLAPVYLNIIELAKGEAIYLPAGVPHSYIHGFALELMANSDNVIRGGLTGKHVDEAEYLKTVNFSPFKPEIMTAPLFGCHTYPTPDKDFSLSVIQGKGTPLSLDELASQGPYIALLTSGNALVKDRENDAVYPLKTGESIFIQAGKKLEFSGNFTAHIAAAYT